MRAKSIKGSSTEEIRQALEQSKADGFRPTLAIVFISIKQDRKTVCELLQQEGVEIMGATSCGEFINGYQDMGTAAILLLDLNRDAFTLLYEEIGSGTVSEAAARLAQTAREKYNRPAFILCSTSLTVKTELLDGEVLVRSMEKVTGPDVNIYGGMAGDDGSFTGTFVFNRERSTDNGIIALVLDEDRISIQGMAISGWKPFGFYRTVTKSVRNMIYTIDNLPAVDVYLRFLGKTEVTEKYKLFDAVGVHYPFHIERESGETVIRTPMSIDKEQDALVCDFDVPQGSRLRFSMPPDFDIVEKVLGDARELKQNSQLDAEALLIFSCAGRLSALGPLVGQENEGLYEIWKAPMAGFFTYGEYGRSVYGRQEFHSTTCCWVALKEK